MGECMIPKIIHYCWFGKNPKPKLAKKCIKSWKKKCPDYKIIEWNEDNFNISEAPLYVRQAYEAKKWAFVTDYVRLKVVYDNGGIYLDTDVEVKKSLDSLLNYSAYFGFENMQQINTGLGFGAEKYSSVLYEIIKQYDNIPFIRDDGKYDNTTCPMRNTEVFLNMGLIQNNTKQVLGDNVLILPTQFLCPIDYESGVKNITSDTYSIHWFSASWHSKEEKKIYNKWIKRKKRKEKIDYIVHIPNRVMMFCLGNKRYEELKKFLKR